MIKEVTGEVVTEETDEVRYILVTPQPLDPLAQELLDLLNQARDAVGG